MQFYGEVFESQLKKNVLRVEVEDKDTLYTPGWRAKYFFVDKKEEEFFQIETDPKTNEGILHFIKVIQLISIHKKPCIFPMDQVTIVSWI